MEKSKKATAEPKSKVASKTTMGASKAKTTTTGTKQTATKATAKKESSKK